MVQLIAPSGKVVEASPAAGNHPLAPALTVGETLRNGSRISTIRSTATAKGLNPARKLRVLAEGSPQAPGWTVVVAASLTQTDEAVHRAQLLLLAGSLLAIVLAGTGAWLLAGAALKPVESMRKEAERIAATGSNGLLGMPRRDDELASLAGTVNALLASQRAALERQRAFTADAGHELRTPFTVLQAQLELADRPGRTRDQLRQAVRDAAGEAERLAHLAEDLLLLSRMDADQPLVVEPVDMDDLMNEVAQVGSSRGVARAIQVSLRQSTRPGGGTTIAGDRSRLRRALDNLVDNALRAAPEGSEIILSTIWRHDEVAIEVHDHGPGFPESFLPRAFERFSRPDSARGSYEGGSGLGLAIVGAIAAAHGGRAEVANDAEGGAIARMVVPLRRRALL
jgi:hypothetical protein